MSKKSKRNKPDEVPVAPKDTWMRRNGATCVGGVVLVYIFVAAAFQTWNLWGFRKELTKSFDGSSAGLTRTQIAPTLDTPIEKGKNVIWCATFLAGWKQLQQNVTNGPVKMTNADEVCARLNAAPVPTMPAEALYANAGTVEKGVIKTIHEDMKARFPSKVTPSFGDLAGRSFVFYSYLEARVPFALLYRDNPKPLEFTSSDGVKTPIRSFGFTKKDHDLHQLLEQPGLLMVTWEKNAGKPGAPAKPASYAIDLCRKSKPYQIVVARTPQKESLAATLESLNQAVAAFDARGESESLEGCVLEVPDMFWRLSHHFQELEQHIFENPELHGQSLAVALQEIQFRLDRSGAEVRSEAKGIAESKAGHDGRFAFDGPFLLYIKKRGEAAPFLVIWVDNAELLQRWGYGSSE